MAGIHAKVTLKMQSFGVSGWVKATDCELCIVLNRLDTAGNEMIKSKFKCVRPCVKMTTMSESTAEKSLSKVCEDAPSCGSQE